MSKKFKPTISNHRKELIKLLEKAAHSSTTLNVFNDFITVSALSISNSSDSYYIANSKEVWNQREKRYLDTINKYDKNTRSLFPQMFAELVEELQEAATSHYTDVLGEIFSEMGFHDKRRNQFFTPQHISDLMAMMTIDSDTSAKTIEERGFITVNEPCCGAGSLLIGAINAMLKLNLNPSKQMLIVANDIDELCVLMCYIQLSLYGIPAVVIRQNTITGESFGHPWFSPVFIFDGWSCRVNHLFHKTSDSEKTDLAQIVLESLTTDEDKPVTGQLSLF